MALQLSGSLNLSGSIAAQTVTIINGGGNLVSSSQQIKDYFTFAQTSSANTFYGTQTITGSVAMTGSLRVGDWIGGSPHVDEAARFDVRTTVDRGIKITGNVSSDVILTVYRGASDDLVRGMRLQGNAVNFYIGDGNANTGSYVGGFTTNGLAFENGKGIDFSATSNGSGTTSSELLNDYEEGTWTPTDASGGGLSFTVLDARYTKIGRQVQCFAQILWPTNSDANNAVVGGLPFSKASTTGAAYGAFVVYTTYGSTTTWLMTGATNTSAYSEAGANLTNTNLSAKQFRLVWIYEA